MSTVTPCAITAAKLDTKSTLAAQPRTGYNRTMLNERFVASNRRSNHEDPAHRAIVEAGGGVYVRGMLMGELVLFNAPATGSTLAVKICDLTVENVRAKIIASNKKFGV